MPRLFLFFWPTTKDERPTTSYNSRIKRQAKSRVPQPSVGTKTDARLGRVIRLLVGNATVVVSGTKIAEELGTTRSEVWRLVQELRRLGLEIAGHPATGYRLKAMPDLILPDMIQASIKGTIFAKNLHHYYSIGSTNTAAMEAAHAGAPEGSVFLSEEQTAGRGRADHTWHSAQSTGIYCSVILRPSIPPSEVLILSLAAGIAVCDAVKEIVPEVALDLKWPNDLLIQRKKVCGILTEMNAEATRVRHIVVGIGLNVNQASFPDELKELATSLRIETGTEWSRVELCAALLKSLDRGYRALLEKPDAHASILRRFEEKSSLVRGRRIHVDADGGYECVTEGLDARGFLQVRTDRGLRVVLSGDTMPR